MKMPKEKEQREKQMEEVRWFPTDGTDILEEIEVEDLTVDGICGVY